MVSHNLIIFLPLPPSLLSFYFILFYFSYVLRQGLATAQTVLKFTAILSQSPECLDYRREPLNLIEIFITILSQGDCHMDPCGTEWVFTGGWACAHLVSGSEGPEVFICTELGRNSLREGMNG